MLSNGFRPFFLLAGLWSPVALALSVAMIQGKVALPTAFDVLSWHVHELLFGFVACAVAGFLLTAIPNWTGRFPLQGMPLLGLVLLWLAGRVAVAVSAVIGPWIAALIDLSFLLALAGATVREIVAGRNWRNLPIVAAIILLLIGNALSHADAIGVIEAAGSDERFSIAVVIMLIALIGGRITPSFTRNWLAKRGSQALPTSFGTFDRLTLAVSAIGLILWTVASENVATLVCVGLAGLLNLVRLARWRGLATYSEPLLWVLHIAYLWIPLGLLLLALNYGWPAASSGAVHALTAGAMGTMILAVMSRATLGHTGRDLHAGAGMTIAYLLVTLAALLRVGAALWADYYMPMLTGASVAWIGAFLLYLVVCAPMLLSPRVE